uniref:Ig-like domain-containing protein n=1 Tax=Fundulus heteroclitus TaxID=8078 RepID=A0A3Q2Q1C3_FUNHE
TSNARGVVHRNAKDHGELVQRRPADLCFLQTQHHHDGKLLHPGGSQHRRQGRRGDLLLPGCRVAGSSPVEVLWLKDGKPLAQGGEFSMLYDDNTAVLQISRGEMMHSGEYTCVATNSVGSASCRAKLTMQGVGCMETPQLELLFINWDEVSVLFV